MSGDFKGLEPNAEIETGSGPNAATKAFLELVNIIAAESGKTRPDVARRRALVAAATMIGALTMSRIVTDSELSASILREVEKQLVDRRLTKYRRLGSRESGADK